MSESRRFESKRRILPAIVAGVLLAHQPSIAREAQIERPLPAPARSSKAEKCAADAQFLTKALRTEGTLEPIGTFYFDCDLEFFPALRIFQNEHKNVEAMAMTDRVVNGNTVGYYVTFRKK